MVYGVRLSDVSVEYIHGFLADGKTAEALEYLKEHAVNGEVLLSHELSWDLIPDPSLDPWASSKVDSSNN